MVSIPNRRSFPRAGFDGREEKHRPRKYSGEAEDSKYTLWHLDTLVTFLGDSKFCGARSLYNRDLFKKKKTQICTF